MNNKKAQLQLTIQKKESKTVVSRAGQSLTPEQRARLEAVYATHGIDGMAEWLVNNRYSGRSRMPRDADKCARDLISRHLGNPAYRSRRKILAWIIDCVEALEVVKSPRLGLVRLPVTSDEERWRLELDSRDKRLTESFGDMIAQTIAQTLKTLVPQLMPPTTVHHTVIPHPAKHRDVINNLVRGACVGRGNYESGYRHLWTAFEFEKRVRFDDYAPQGKPTGWRLDVAEEQGWMPDLLNLARRLFSKAG